MIASIPIILLKLSLLSLLTRIIILSIKYSIIIEWEICSIFSIPIKLELMLEWRRILYSSIILFISSNVLKFSKRYIRDDHNNLRFLQTILIFITSINILIYIPNIIFLLIGWDGLGVSSFILVIYYNNARSLSAGILTIITNRLGDVFLLISIASILNRGTWLSLYHLRNNSFNLQWTGILIAALTKRAQIPYSSWLPAAMAAPTPVSALVHSSTLVTAGIFILYRFNKIVTASKTIQLTIILTSISTILIAALVAIYEHDIKKIIALSTLRQLGLIAMPTAFNMPILTFFHISIHAIFKALLFITRGTIIVQNNHNQDLRLYGLFHTLAPINSTAILISSIALMGVPFLTGYYSKHIIIIWSSYISINTTIYLLLLLSIILTSLYSLRLFIFISSLPTKKHPLHKQKRHIDNTAPLITISITRITIGRIIQWLTPLRETCTIIDEVRKSRLMNFIILSSAGLIILLITLKPHKINFLNKLLRSIIFITPISTQFILPAYLNLSLLLYKQLDQSWLENLSRIGPSNQFSYFSLQANLTISKLPQNTLLYASRTRAAVITVTSILLPL